MAYTYTKYTFKIVFIQANWKIKTIKRNKTSYFKYIVTP
jgi:hypothetical protein